MMHVVRTISYVIVMLAAILLGINAIFNYDVISAMFGDGTLVTRIMYALVGISGIVLLATQDYRECCACPDTHL